MIRSFLATIFLVSASFASAQTAKPVPPETLGLTQGTHEFDAGDYIVTLVDHSGVAIKLVPKNDGGFDFLPYDRLDKRNSDGFAHLGDIDFKYRKVGEDKWEVYSTFSTRGEATHYTKTKNPNSFAVYGLPGAGELEVTRHWKTETGVFNFSFR